MASGLHPGSHGGFVKTYRNLYARLCSRDNLKRAFMTARKGKTLKDYVVDFESELEKNLSLLKYELETFTYAPAPLTTFIVRDPKARTISASNFRDRVVHHALYNVIAHILEGDFIYDSFANQKGKGVHKAVKRFERFSRKVGFCYKCSSPGRQTTLFRPERLGGYALKADIRHYFDTIDHETLLLIIRRKIRDPNVMRLIRSILQNHKIGTPGRGCHLGTLPLSSLRMSIWANSTDLLSTSSRQDTT